MNGEKLIELACYYPVLYDLSNLKCMESDFKNDIWSKIGEEIKITECVWFQCEVKEYQQTVNDIILTKFVRSVLTNSALARTQNVSRPVYYSKPSYRFRVMDYLVRCPYNDAHHVYSSRLTIHLIKCSRRSLIKMSVCPYEATHHVRAEEYENHLRHCPNKTFKDSFLDFRNEMQNKHWDDEMLNTECQLSFPEKNPLEENWDDIVDQVGTYNADEMSKLKKVLRTTALRSKNERKWFRKQEKERYDKLQAQEPQEKFKPMDSLVRCPYNNAHHVYSSRLNIHLIKCCRRSLIKMSVCPYEATHHVRVEEYENHLRHCPNKTVSGGFLDIRNEIQNKHWDDEMLNTECHLSSPETNPFEENWDDIEDQLNTEYHVSSPETNPLEENWDDIVDQVGTYNADEMSKLKKVLRNPGLGSRHDHKLFRRQEKERFEKLKIQECLEKLEKAHLDEPDKRGSA